MIESEQQESKKYSEPGSRGKNNRSQRSGLPSAETDFVKIVRRCIEVGVLIAGYFASVLYSSEPHAALWLFALMCVFLLIDLELYWVHTLGHPNLFADCALVWLVACVMFIGTGSIYLATTESHSIPLFKNEGLSVRDMSAFQSAPPTNDVSFSFGGMIVIPEGPMLSDILSGKPTPPVEEERNGKLQYPVLVYVEDGRMFCDFDMYSGHGNSPIVVKRNRIIKPLPYNWDSNSSENALEVVDNFRRPVFQLYKSSPTSIVFNGIFATDSLIYIVQPDGDYPGLAGYAPNSIALTAALKQFILKPMFKYPSAVFPHMAN